MTRLFFFIGLIFALFGIYLTQYIGQSREAYELWVQEIAYNKYTQTESINESEKLKLFSKIESLAKGICQLADSIFYLFTIFCLAFFITTTITIYELFDNNISNQTANAVNLNLFYSGMLDNYESRILVASLILSTILFFSLPKILRDAHINIINPKNSSKIDEKIFSVWYKHRCFEHKYGSYSCKLQPKRLYEILAQKCQNEETTLDGKDIEIPEDIKKEMERQGLFK